MDEEGKQSGSGYGLRDKPRPDYKTMHHGDDKFEQVQSYNHRDKGDQSSGAVGGESDDEDFDLFASAAVATQEDYEREMMKGQEEMRRLHEEETKLRRAEELRQMKRQIAEKKLTVKKLRGKQTVEKPQVSKKITKEALPHSSKGTILSSKTGSKIINTFKSKSSDSDSEKITVQSLRKDSKLKQLVQKELRKLGLQSDSNDTSSDSSSSDGSSSSDSSDDECVKKSSKKKKQKKKKKKMRSNDSSSDSSSSGGSSSSDSSDDEYDQKSAKKKHKKKKKKKSGISAKSSDKVKFPQKWPHAHLQYEYVNRHLKYDELDFKLFVVGELEILSGENLPKAESKGRLSLLKKIIYYSGTYEFKGLKAFYAAWLREIELGKRSWSDDLHQLEGAILTKYLQSSKSPIGKPNKDYKPFDPKKGTNIQADETKVWFCQSYQRNKCEHKSSHMVVVKGKAKMALHICATCWQKDKVQLPHPESSTSCPHASV